VAADESLAAHRYAGAAQRRDDVVDGFPLRHRDEERGAVEAALRNGDEVGKRRGGARSLAGPARHFHAPHGDVAHDRVGMRPRDREHRQPGRMIGALDEGQAGDDLRRIVAFERAPPGAAGSGRRHEAEIAVRLADLGDHAGRAHVGDQRHREAEMEALGVAHRRLAGREIDMHAERRLHEGKRRDDDAQDAFGRIERKDSAMALDQPAHHVGLARRAECRAGLRGALDPDETVDDLAALHQQAVHLAVDAVDLGAQLGERRRVGCFRHEVNGPVSRMSRRKLDPGWIPVRR
jgi:hypothetical protein